MNERIIMVIEDSKTMKQVIEMTCKNQGLAPVLFREPQEALQQLEQVRPDAVVVDTSLDVLDGYEVAAAIRQGPMGDWLPVVLMASRFFPHDSMRAEQCGVDAHVVKPFDTKAFLTKVREVIDLGDRRKQAKGRISTSAKPAGIRESAPSGFGRDSVQPGRASEQPPLVVGAERFPARNPSAPPTFSRPSRPGELRRRRESAVPLPTWSVDGTPVEEVSPFSSNPPDAHTPAMSTSLRPSRAPAAAAHPSDLFLQERASSPPPSRISTPHTASHGAAQRLSYASAQASEQAPGQVPGKALGRASVIPARASQPALEASRSSSAGSEAGASDAIGDALTRFRHRLGQLGLSRELQQSLAGMAEEAIEQVVWEVVPELAEVMIKEELRRITSA